MDVFGWTLLVAAWMVVTALLIWLDSTPWMRRVRDNQDEHLAAALRERDAKRRR